MDVDPRLYSMLMIILFSAIAGIVAALLPILQPDFATSVQFAIVIFLCGFFACFYLLRLVIAWQKSIDIDMEE